MPSLNHDQDQREAANSGGLYVCDRCGLCCRHLLVEAYALDVLREPRIEAECPLGKRHPDLDILDACWILSAVKPCPFLGLDNRCGIYATRPGTCVGFAAGSAQCQQLRREHGVPPLLPCSNEQRKSMDPMTAEILQALLAPE